MGRFIVGLLAGGVASLLLAGCAEHQKAPPAKGGYYSAKHSYKAPKRAQSGYVGGSKDGAPGWSQDVSQVPDAVPEVHDGPIKADPYTVLGKKYYPMQDASSYKAKGTASWYGTKFHGQKTANGEDYDLYGMTAAHKTLPLPCFVRVTNLDNGRSVVVRVNDRGPFYSDRIIDLSYAAATKLGYANIGTARVSVEGIDPVQWQAQHGKGASRYQSVAQSRPIERPTVLAASSGAGSFSTGQGMYLQVGAFASVDAAESLKNKVGQRTGATVIVDSVVRNQQTLHRVRLGPLRDQSEVRQMQDSLRLANLGQSTLVQAE